MHGSDTIDKSQQENYKNESGKAGVETLRTYTQKTLLLAIFKKELHHPPMQAEKCDRNWVLRRFIIFELPNL